MANKRAKTTTTASETIDIVNDDYEATLEMDVPEAYEANQVDDMLEDAYVNACAMAGRDLRDGLEALIGASIVFRLEGPQVRALLTEYDDTVNI